MSDKGDNSNRRQHTSRQFAQELKDIQSKLFILGGMVEEQIALSLKCLFEHDPVLAEQVIRDDRKINSLEVDIDEDCTRVLARRQPAASDLRLVVAVIKTVADLERIGDDAKRIARCSLFMVADYPKRNQMSLLESFGKQVGLMVKDSLDALARLDVELAMQVKEKDDHIDAEYRTIVQAQLASMSQDARAIPIALNLMWIARALERIADRACNICEYVIYYALGKDIRHMTLEQAQRDLVERKR